ncbi:hypothetical protein [Yonghaparkia sp. Root332]|uniref:hypothetical protein n=1 Tax=Yonghaparkia sp. Root332 TaxID=1736516 RepID=UPI000700C703|nr:hypothetical protein [Yonghaparkia sp. Root332]KQV24539.1 hypothetical protein ASC54_08350 [Yonghaparkia sp. Root332]
MSIRGIPGDASVLAREGAGLDEAASGLLDLTRALHRLADEDESIGRAADALRERTGEAAQSVLRVEPRYRVTAEVVSGFASVVDDAQGRVRAAASRAEDALVDRLGIDDRLAELDAARPGVEEVAELLDWEERRDALLRLREDAVERLRDAEAAAERARDEWWEAGGRAAERVSREFEELSDSLVDAIVSAVVSAAEAAVDAIEQLDAWIDAVAEWASTVLRDAVTMLVISSAALAAAGFLLSVLVVAFSSPLVLSALASGALTVEQVIDQGIALTLQALPVLAPAILLLLADEASRPTPAMRRDRSLEKGHLSRDDQGLAQYAFQQAAVVDALGHDSSTVVQVVEVLDESGERVGWRVTPPSTQDWQLHGDRGAMNDLSSNLALMLQPESQAAYERAVLSAMEGAGIQPGDPVMLVGFSQGGILAGKLAADPDVPYEIDAILVAGAPIDHFDIPRSGPDAPVVLSLQHGRGDIVHRLDGVAPVDSERWRTVAVDPPPGEAAHNAGSYAATAREHLDGAPAGELSSADIERFFSENERVQYFQGAER